MKIKWATVFVNDQETTLRFYADVAIRPRHAPEFVRPEPVHKEVLGNA
jgi:hypothetical protein